MIGDPFSSPSQIDIQLLSFKLIRKRCSKVNKQTHSGPPFLSLVFPFHLRINSIIIILLLIISLSYQKNYIPSFVSLHHALATTRLLSRLRQCVPHIGHLHILALLVVAANLKDQGTHVGGDLLLADQTHHLGHGQVHALRLLVLFQEERVQHAHVLREHRDVQLVLALKVLDELVQRQLTGQLEPIPQRPLDVVILLLGRPYRLRASAQRQGQVDKVRTELLQGVVAGGRGDKCERFVIITVFNDCCHVCHYNSLK